MDKKPRQDYKLVKWMFGKYEKIPEDWELKSTSEILKIIMGQSPPSESYNQDKKGLPFYQGVTDFGDIYPDPKFLLIQFGVLIQKKLEKKILFYFR